MDNDRRAAAVASLRGLAVGDAIGSCFFVPSNYDALVARQLPPDPWYWTDDAEMACSVFAILDRCGLIDQDELAASFAEHHDFDRGYGPGVNRMLRLIRREGADWRTLVAESWDGRGSWGNGAAMRVAPLGAHYGGEPLEFVAAEAKASAEVTHTHPEGVAGAIAVAVAVSAQDTVPFCLWVVAKHPQDFAEAFWATACVGGDIDTNCAIVGGITAARVGLAGIPGEWLARCEALPGWVNGLGDGHADNDDVG